jgi:hypothetical protein
MLYFSRNSFSVLNVALEEFEIQDLLQNIYKDLEFVSSFTRKRSNGTAMG